MPFDEALKVRVQRRASFRCCWCVTADYCEVHHVTPESEGGPNTEDNAAPLCPTCHEKYGANPTKRKAIRDRRDYWYEICANKAKSVDTMQLEQINAQLQKVATKDDLNGLLEKAVEIVRSSIAPSNVSFLQAREAVAHVTSSVVSSMASIPARIEVGNVFRVVSIVEAPRIESVAVPKVHQGGSQYTLWVKIVNPGPPTTFNDDWACDITDAGGRLFRGVKGWIHGGFYGLRQGSRTEISVVLELPPELRSLTGATLALSVTDVRNNRLEWTMEAS